MSLEIEIFRTVAGVDEIVTTVKPTDTSAQVKKIMGDNLCNLVFELNGIVDFKIGDQAIIFGELYRMNRMPVIKKVSRYNYEYTMQLQSEQYDLAKAQYMFYDSNNDLKEGDFSLMGTADTFIELMIKNLARVGFVFVKGGIPSTGYKNITFSKEDCLTALQKISDAFDIEYYVEGNTINLSKLVNASPHVLKYGRNRGLYDITRTQAQDMDIITRLYAFGSTENLPAGYLSSRLRLPGGYDVLVNNITYDISLVNPNLRRIRFNWTAPTNISVTSIIIEYRIIGTNTWREYEDGSVTTPRDFYGHFRFVSNSIGSISATAPNTLVTDYNIGYLLREGDRLKVVDASTGIAGMYTILSISGPVGSDYTLTTLETVPTAAASTSALEVYRSNLNDDFEFRFRSMPIGAVTPAITILHTDGTNSTPIFSGAPNQLSFLEKNIDLYGIIEGDFIDDDIKPDRQGTVTAVSIGDPFQFTDDTMDFDVNDQLAPGIAAKVTFNTGQLAGYTFEIKSYNNATKTFRILLNKDEAHLELPSLSFSPQVGDVYVLHDIYMPSSYVLAAETRLLNKAIEFLDKNSKPDYTYNLTCDPAYFRRNQIKVNIGDVIWVSDIELDIDKYIRVIGLSKSLVDEFEYTLELGETISKSTISRITASQATNSSNINSVTNQVNNNALLNGRFIGTFKIEQGTINIKDIETASSTAGMKKLWIDTDGKVWKEA